MIKIKHLVIAICLSIMVSSALSATGNGGSSHHHYNPSHHHHNPSHHGHHSHS